jgi:hypothetical protein
MSYRAQPAFPSRAVDTSAKLHADAVSNVKAAGYSCIIRYVPHAGSQGTLDIDAAERAAIVDGGLALMLVQHVRAHGWDPGSVSGKADGEYAVQFARQAGYERGAHLFVDLEDIVGSAQATKKYAEDWAKAVIFGGYLAGAYVGYNVPLTPQQLYYLHGINSYWSDLGPRHVDTRGFAMKQHATIVINGIKYDPNDIQPDGRGETPRWMVAVSDAIA